MTKLLVLSTIALALLAAPSALLAQAPPVKMTQAPGYYRMAVGDFEVTALYDGFVDMDPKLLKGATEQDLGALFDRMFVERKTGIQTSINAFLVNTGSNLVLVDTGMSKRFGPNTGFIPDNIRAAGYDPSQVDTVLLTHLHRDHVLGLVGPDGKAAFPNAVVRVMDAEAAYWLSGENEALAPKEKQGAFALVREALAPYKAAGKFKTFSGGGELLPGVRAVPLAGHTPGHCGYLFTSRGQSLLAWGDIIHNAAVQFAHPGISIDYDVDQKAAVAARQRVLAEAAGKKWWVAGAHLPFPGIGHVRAEGKGYAWVPVEFGPVGAIK